MFGWLRDAIANAPSSFVSRHSTGPSTSTFRQQKQREHFSSDDDDDDLNHQSNDNSFYHNPYHSSGQMNYVDVPQQQYTNEYNYPTYLAKQQTSQNHSNQSIDQQIHEKLLALKQRTNQYQSYAHRQNNYAFRNRTIPLSPRTSVSTQRLPRVSNKNTNQTDSQDTRSDEDDDGDDDDDDDDDDDSSSTGPFQGIPGYYSDRYSNIDEQFDLASVVLWYKNVMQSVKKFL